MAYLLWFLLGVVGAHQFYLGKTGRAISYIFTFGWLGIGLLIDLFTLPKQVRAANGQAY
jgi:TM2 domain-containing membrane protein YozV